MNISMSGEQLMSWTYKDMKLRLIGANGESGCKKGKFKNARYH